MFFTRIVQALVLAAALASAYPTPELDKRQPNAFFCTDAGFKGNCFLSTTNGCISVGSDFNDNVSSFGPDPGVFCNLYSDIGCSGNELTLSNPGQSNLETLGFNDVMSSFQCGFLGWSVILFSSRPAMFIRT